MLIIVSNSSVIQKWTGKSIFPFLSIFYSLSSVTHKACSQDRTYIIGHTGKFFRHTGKFVLIVGKFLYVRFRGSHRRCSTRKKGLRPATLLKLRLWYRCFPVSFLKFSRTSFWQNTSGRLFLELGIPCALAINSNDGFKRACGILLPN